MKSVADSSTNLLSLEQVALAGQYCPNGLAARKLKTMIQPKMADASVIIGENRGLCSCYAEQGGLPVGFEKL